jgi:hypothetical protein
MCADSGRRRITLSWGFIRLRPTWPEPLAKPLACRSEAERSSTLWPAPTTTSTERSSMPGLKGRWSISPISRMPVITGRPITNQVPTARVSSSRPPTPTGNHTGDDSLSTA